MINYIMELLFGVSFFQIFDKTTKKPVKIDVPVSFTTQIK